MDLCKYSNVFGEPGTGAHSYRLYDFAVVDILLTVVLAYVIALFFPKENRGNYFLMTLVISFLLGIVSHRIFCVRTTLDKLFFPGSA